MRGHFCAGTSYHLRLSRDLTVSTFGVFYWQGRNDDVFAEEVVGEGFVEGGGIDVAEVVVGDGGGDQIEAGAGDGAPVLLEGCGGAGFAVAVEEFAGVAAGACDVDAGQFAVGVERPVGELAAVEDFEGSEGVDDDGEVLVGGGQGKGGEEDLPLGDVEQEGLFAEAFQARVGGHVAVVADDAAGEPAFEAAEQPEPDEEACLLLKAAQVGARDLMGWNIAAGEDGVEHGGVGGAFGAAGCERRSAAERGAEQKQAGEREGEQRDEGGEDDFFGSAADEALGGDVEGEDEAVDGPGRQQVGDQQKAGEQGDHGLGGFALNSVAIAAAIEVRGLSVLVQLIAETLLVGERHGLERALGTLAGDTFADGLGELCDVIDHGLTSF